MFYLISIKITTQLKWFIKFTKVTTDVLAMRTEENHELQCYEKRGKEIKNENQNH